MRRIGQINGAKKFYAGLIYIVIGTSAFLWSQTYEIGNATHMGPGYFPALIGLVLLGLGIVSTVNGYRAETPDPILRHKLEPFFLVLAGIVSFALLIDHAGLIVAIFVTVLLVCLRRALKHPVEVLLTYVALAAFSGLVFVYLFGMSIPLFWWDN